MKSSIWVVILNYMTYSLTIKCADLLGEQDYDNMRIVIVDNNSPNDSGVELERYCREKGLYYISSKENGGYAKGNNLGIRFAMENGAKYIAVINNDVTLSDNNFLTRLVEYMEDNPKIGLVGPAVYTNGVRDVVLMKNRPSAKAEILVNFARLFLWVVGKIKKRTNRPYPKSGENERVSEEKNVYAVSGCCMFFSAEHLKTIELFDEGTFLYNEELIIGEKCFKHNIPIVYNTQFEILHDHGITISEYVRVKKQLLAEEISRLYYYKKFRSDVSRLEYFLLKLSAKFNRIVNIPIIRHFSKKTKRSKT